jgi:hypothetical protein
MRYMTSSLPLLLLIAVLATSSCAQQTPFLPVTDAIGQVELADGLPSVTRNSRPYILDEQSLVYAGDLLRTDERSTLTIRLGSGSVISLGPETQLLFTVVEQRENEFRSILSLTTGSMHVSQRTSADQELTVRTRIATAASRSGAFWLGYDRNNPTLTVIALGDRLVTVSNTDGEVELNRLHDTTSVPAGAGPRAVTGWSEDRASRTIDYYFQVQP